MIRFIYLCIYVSWPYLAAGRILVPRPGIKPMLPAKQEWILNHGTAREVSEVLDLKNLTKCSKDQRKEFTVRHTPLQNLSALYTKKL